MRRWLIGAVLLILAGCGVVQQGNPTATQPAVPTAAQPTTATGGGQPTATTDASGQPTTAPGSGQQKSWPQPPAMTIDPKKKYTAVIETTKGTMTAELYPQDAPITVNNFVFLARQGFFENIKFHR